MDGYSRLQIAFMPGLGRPGECISTLTGDKAKNADKVHLDCGSSGSSCGRLLNGVQHQVQVFFEWLGRRAQPGFGGDADLQPQSGQWPRIADQQQRRPTYAGFARGGNSSSSG